MSIDTLIIVPVKNPERARRLLADEAESAEVGSDFVAVYFDERFDDVAAEPEWWGPEFVDGLPLEVRQQLDTRGLFATDEGLDCQGQSYRQVVAEGGVWLPTQRPRLPPPISRRRHLYLVPLSNTRKQMLMDEPAIVRDLVDMCRSQPLPTARLLGPIWVELQRALFEVAHAAGDDDRVASALFPRSGLLLYEDRDVEGARLVPEESVRLIASWLLTVSADALASVDLDNLSSPAARAFPESLGPAEADDYEPPPAGERFAPDALREAISELKPLYRHLLDNQLGLLAIRFREA